MPVEARRHRRLVAARRAVLPQEAGLHVRRAGDERVAFPAAGREAAARVLGVLRRVRPAVHPDGHRRAIFPRADRVGDRRALDRLGVAPDLQTERTLHEIERRPSLALAFDHRQLRLVVGQRPRAPLVVEREPDVVHRVRVARDVFGVPRRPRPDELGLRKGARDSPARTADTSEQRAPMRRSVTTWPSMVLDPIWNRPLLS